jgi:hypothetical protein
MSLRSLRLRHQNGQAHSIPFGQVQSVTNYSRDWSVVKLNLHLDPGADIETVRWELLNDPEIGGDFIQPSQIAGCHRCAADGPCRPLQVHRDTIAPDLFAASGIASPD